VNSRIASYFDEIEARFIASPAITTFQILRRDVSDIDGIFRVKAKLIDTSQGEFFENVIETNSEIKIRKYSFHWQDQDGKLIKQWDNAAHHLEYGTSHHLHQAVGSVIAVHNPLNILRVILEIEIELANKGK
jgi:hypothetical protein